MSGVNSEFVVVVSLHNFFNLELLHKGWFYIAISLKVETPSGRVASSASDVNYSPLRNALFETPGDAAAPFRCAPFSIEYIDQEVELDKTFVYRIVLEDACKLEGTQFRIDFDLHHTQVDAPTTKGQGPPLDAFKCVARESIRLCNVHSLQQHFYPLHFESGFLSLANTAILCTFAGLSTGVSFGGAPPAASLAAASGGRHACDAGTYVQSMHSPIESLTDDSLITASDLRQANEQSLRHWCDRLKGAVMELWTFQSDCREHMVSGMVSELRQFLVADVTTFKGQEALGNEALRILAELRKLCRFAITQYVNQQRVTVSTLFEHWRYSRCKVSPARPPLPFLSLPSPFPPLPFLLSSSFPPLPFFLFLSSSPFPFPQRIRISICLVSFRHPSLLVCACMCLTCVQMRRHISKCVDMRRHVSTCVYMRRHGPRRFVTTPTCEARPGTKGRPRRPPKGRRRQSQGRDPSVDTNPTSHT